MTTKTTTLTDAAATLGRKGGSSTSEAKRAASRENGKKGGRPKIITIDPDEIQDDFLTPPENQGQIVEVSYACTEDYILECTTDRSDNSTKIVAYQYPADGSEDGGIEPWNGVPNLGRRAGLVRLLADD